MAPIQESEMVTTKRVVVSEVAKLYDLHPVIVIAKLFIQQFWTGTLDWDESLSEQNLRIFRDFQNKMI